MNTTATSDTLALLGRVMAAAIFIMGGWSKLMATAGTKAYFAQTGLPLPDFTYWVVVLIELGGGALLLLGWQTRIVAIVLAAFCLGTAGVAHSNFAAAGQQIQFMKNLAMAGGFLAFAAFGGGAFSLDGMIGRRRAIA